MTVRLAALLLFATFPAACSSSAPGPRPAPVPPPSPPVDPVAAALDAIREPDLVADVAWLTAPDLKGRGSFSAEAKATADHLERELTALGYQVVRRPIPDSGGQENVIGVLPGRLDRAGETLILCAHYDHLGEIDGQTYWGADDNASGVAVLLALARAAAAVRRAEPETPRRTLLVLATGAEEAGLLGAGAYVRDPLRPLAGTRAVLNFDMVGRNFVELFLNWEATFGTVGLETDETLDGAVRAAVDAEAGVKMVPVTGELLTLFGFDRRTDDWWFRDRGVPAASFSTGFHSDYHQPTDTADQISSAQMLRVARVAARALLTLW